MAHHYSAEGRPTREATTQPDYMQDLWQVGPKKPLGYLPLDTIKHICDQDVEAVREACENRGLKTLLFSEDACTVRSGALYVYDHDALDEMLSNNLTTLVRANWPTEPEAFIQGVATTFAEDSALYELVARTFADKRQEYQQPT